MNIKSLLLSGAVLFAAAQTNAQSWVIDSVTMDASYANDVFYNLATGSETPEPADNWDIAFQMTKFGDNQFSASVRANHIKGKVGVYSLHKSGADFASISDADSIGKTARELQLFNIDSTWGEGAFTQNRDMNSMFDFGWGMYAGAPTHFVVGDSVYLVKANNNHYKLWIQEYISTGDTIGYKFRVANYDGTGDTVMVVKRTPTYENKLFAYYNFASNSFLDREPNKADWHLLFTQYAKPLIFGPNGLQAYTGVLTNLDIEVSEVTTIDPDSIDATNYVGYLSNASTQINIIGDNWKTFNGSTYDMDTMKSFLIKTLDDKYYHVKFTRFDGGFVTGRTVFAKRELVVTSVNDVNSNIATYSIAPNPAANTATIMFDAKQADTNTRIMIADMTGKVVYSTTTPLRKGLNAYNVNVANLATGTYIVSLSNGSWNVAQKLMVQH